MDPNPFPDLKILFLTVGEKVAETSLKALLDVTPRPYSLTIWYDTCGRGVDEDLYKQLRSASDDVMLLTKNHGPAAASAYGMLYLPCKYLMMVLADTVVQKGYLERFEFVFRTMEKVAAAGCLRVDDHPDIEFPWDFMINAREFVPDGVVMYSKAAINDIGGICPAFNMFGQTHLDWYLRAREKDWNLVSCKGIMKEIGTTHDGRNMNPDLQKMNRDSEQTFFKINEVGRSNMKWWDSSLAKLN